MTALACGMIAVGSCNGDVTSTILQTIMEKSETELKDTYARWLPLGLGLNHLGEGMSLYLGKRLTRSRYNREGVCVSQAVLCGSKCLLTPQFYPVGKGEAIEAILAALEVVSEPFRSFANTLVDVCAYAGLCLCLPSDSSFLFCTFFQITSSGSVILICIRLFSFSCSWSKLFLGAFSLLAFLTLTILLQALGMY